MKIDISTLIEAIHESSYTISVHVCDWGYEANIPIVKADKLIEELVRIAGNGGIVE